MNKPEVLYSEGRNDEQYTPRYGVMPILEFLPKDKIIWCPFDTTESHFVRVLQEFGYTVEYSHIDYGQDYYFYEPPQWDIMVSNPPFGGKRQIFDHLENRSPC